jgi:hypothetical protein
MTKNGGFTALCDTDTRALSDGSWTRPNQSRSGGLVGTIVIVGKVRWRGALDWSKIQ